MDVEEKSLCSRCGEEIETKQNSMAGKIVYEIAFEFSLKFYRFIMMPTNHGICDDWKIDKTCRECIKKLKALLLENGFKLKDDSSEW